MDETTARLNSHEAVCAVRYEGITTVNSTDIFDAGSINILYE